MEEKVAQKHYFGSAKSSAESSANSARNLGERKKYIRKKIYTCDCCDYSSKNITNYKKHLKSKKHLKKMSSQNEKSHPKMKKVIPNEEKVIPTEEKVIPRKPEHEEEIKDLKDQVSNLTKLLGKVLEKGISNTTNNNTNCNNTNINNTMTVNVYLNDHCKDALNIRDFVDQIEVRLEDILHPSKLLKDNIVPNIFMNEIKKLSNEERPVHCADARRGKFFVKDNDKWSEIKKEEPLNPLNNQIGMLKYDVYKKAMQAEEEGIINDDKVQKIRDACGISPTPTKVDNKIINKIASECSLLEARKKKSLENID
jgi:hypothetical protein